MSRVRLPVAIAFSLEGDILGEAVSSSKTGSAQRRNSEFRLQRQRILAELDEV